MFSAYCPHVVRMLSAYDRSIYEQLTVYQCLTMLSSQTFAYRFCHSPISSGNTKLYCKVDTFNPIFPLENQRSRNNCWKSSNCLVIPFSSTGLATPASVTKCPFILTRQWRGFFSKTCRTNATKNACDYLPDFLITSQN